MAVIDDLNLKTTIDISDRKLDFELYTINRGAIIEIKLDGKLYILDKDVVESVPEKESVPTQQTEKKDKTKQTPETSEKATEQIEATVETAEKVIKIPDKTPSTEMRGKAPNNTTLFLNWLKDWKEPRFDVSDFIKKYSVISKEQAEKIAEYQVKQGRLDQLSHTRFRTIKRDAENGPKK